jgi:hypothetical protein
MNSRYSRPRKTAWVNALVTEGTTDHSHNVKIAGGVTVEDLWKQIRFIDRLNNRDIGIRMLKSAEVGIAGTRSRSRSKAALVRQDH